MAERERENMISRVSALFCGFIRNTQSVFVGGDGAFQVQLYSAINLTGENLMTIYFSLSLSVLSSHCERGVWRGPEC